MQSRFLVLFLSLAFALISTSLLGSTADIYDFTVKENLSQNGKLAVIALDTSEQTDNQIQGLHRFSINGFQQDLYFNDGVAVTTHPLTSSTFAFFKHESSAHEIGHFFFLRVTKAGVKTYRINSILLIVIPLIVLYIAYKLKRFLITLLILVLIYYYMNQTKGLDPSQLMEGIVSGLRGWF